MPQLNPGTNSKHSTLWYAATLLALLLASGAAQAEMRGRVVGVVDGDTLDVLVDGREVRVRLLQIDTPERSQAFGTRAKQALSRLVYGRHVRVETDGTDRYGRTLGTVYANGVNVNTEMVRLGMAWAYRRYLTDPSLVDIEAQARRAQRGLWSHPNPTPPWEFRRH